MLNKINPFNKNISFGQLRIRHKNDRTETIELLNNYKDDPNWSPLLSGDTLYISSKKKNPEEASEDEILTLISLRKLRPEFYVDYIDSRGIKNKQPNYDPDFELRRN
jgi:hypothetical protein